MQIEFVTVELCPNLQLELDLININASQLKVQFRKCNRITINSLMFETDFSPDQVLNLSFKRVAQVLLHNLLVDEKLKLIFEKVGSIPDDF